MGLSVNATANAAFTENVSANADTVIELVQDVLAALLSWIVLAAIAIIISGKLIAKRIPLGFNDDAEFKIPLIIFKLKATGDEVSLGLIIFIITLALCVTVGGPDAYEFFKRQSGIDVGQWNSLCVVASFASVFVAVAIYALSPIFRGRPLIAQAERAETLRRLEGQNDDAPDI